MAQKFKNSKHFVRIKIKKFSIYAFEIKKQVKNISKIVLKRSKNATINGGQNSVSLSLGETEAEIWSKGVISLFLTGHFIMEDGEMEAKMHEGVIFDLDVPR